VAEPTEETREPSAPSLARLDVDVHRPRLGVTLVVVRGEVDGDTAPEFGRRLQAAVDGRAERVVLDLSGLTRLAPEGLEALLDVQNLLSARNAVPELLDPSPSVVLLLHDVANGDLPARVSPGLTIP
jgi:Anti-anti-sigma regulatory factor (antagonist of anti-sigma factor)